MANPSATPPGYAGSVIKEKAFMQTVVLNTNYGPITLELDNEHAPVTVANFLQYARDGHYDNTIFHRVINGFMIQGGGFEPGMKQKPTSAPSRTRPTMA